MHAAICCTSACSKVPAGRKSSVRPLTNSSNVLRSARPSVVVITVCDARMPCLSALRRDHDLPRAVRGPVDFEALRRLALVFFSEVGLRDGLEETSSIEPRLLATLKRHRVDAAGT